MSQLNAKLIVSDFDGTLITSDQRILPEVRDAITKYVNDGGIFAVCTGRILASILPRVRFLGLKGLVIACQGTVIADIESGKYIRCGGLAPNETYEVCSAIEELGHPVNAYSGDGFISSIPEDNKYLKIYEDIIGVKADHVGMPVSRYILENNIICQKIAVLCTPEDRVPLYNCLREKFSQKYDVTCSADVLVEVSPIGATKGGALKFLAEHYSIDIGDTVAIGDNLNDLSMIEVAGVGVAVGNGVAELKSKAKFVACTNDEGAVKQVIELFGYRHD